MNLPANRAAWPARWLELWSERAGIMEFSGNLSKATAEFRAEQDIRAVARAEEPEKKRA